MRFIDLKRQYQAYQEEIEAAALKVLRSINYILGEEVAALEAELARFVGVKQAIGVSSGTDALYVALKAFGVKPGEALITTPFTFVATAEVIRRVEARVIFADVNEETMNIDPAGVEKALDEAARRDLRVRGVIAVSLFGLPADLPALEALCQAHDLLLIEDACQSLGAAIGERRSGSFGHAGAVSFFPAKPLGACGDGGMIFTNDEDAARRMRAIRVHGQTRPYFHEYEGLNARLDTLQAAILLVKFRHFEEELAKRQEVARRYHELLGEVPEIKFQKIPEGYLSCYAQFTIRVPRRDELARFLHERGIPTAVYYPRPLHLQPAFADLGYTEGDFPVAERLSREVLSLPMHPFLEPHEQEFIAEAIKSFYGA
jgi:UDP-2-acetamido-2-deoxy-ribo-hexuluronate aminotransferase